MIEYATTARNVKTQYDGAQSMNKPETKPNPGIGNTQAFDAIVIGAGFGGL